MWLWSSSDRAVIVIWSEDHRWAPHGVTAVISFNFVRFRNTVRLFMDPTQKQDSKRAFFLNAKQWNLRTIRLHLQIAPLTVLIRSRFHVFWIACSYVAAYSSKYSR